MSPLSVWAGRSVVRGVRFRAWLLPEGVAEAEAIVLRGDRVQLEALCLAVDRYLEEAWQEPGIVEVSGEIYLRSAGLVGHELVLGKLGRRVQPVALSVLRLSMAQLADLASVLEQYRADVLALPPLQERQGLWQLAGVSARQWRVIAAVAIAAVGAAGVATRIIQLPFPTTIVSTTSDSAAPTLPDSSSKLLPQTSAPQESYQPAQPSAALPPAPLSVTPKARQKAQSQPSSQHRLSTASLPPTDGNQPTGAAPGSTRSSSLGRRFDRPPQWQSPFANAATGEPQVALAPGQPSVEIGQATGSSASFSTTSTLEGFSSPSVQRSVGSPTTTPAPGSLSTSASVPAPEGINLPTGTFSGSLEISVPLAFPSADMVPASDMVPAAELPNAATGTEPTSAPVPRPAALPPAAPSSTSQGSALPSTQGQTNREPPNRAMTRSAPLPQVAEVQQYLEQRWQPPVGLAVPLVYRLLLKPDGSVGASQPLNEAAHRYRASLPLPAAGQPFVSPWANGRSLQLRVVLNPNGRIYVVEEQPDHEHP